MLNPNELEYVPDKLTKLYRALQLNVMEDITDRLSENREITRTVDWEINRLYELGVAKSVIKQHVRRTLMLTKEEINRIYSTILAEDYVRYKPIYREQGKQFIPYRENKQLQQLISGIKEQTNAEFKNITQSLGFAVKSADGTLEFQPIAKFYQNTLDNASMQILSGVYDYNSVLKKAVKQMTDSGLRTVDYASGISNRVEVAARRALMTGFNQVVGKITEENAEKLGTDYFEVTYHRGARPTHQPWQGRVYSKDELVTVCGYGDVTGLKGANCRHDFHPFFKGISKRLYTDEELDRMNAEENTPREYGGKSYTVYEATQRQRRLETALRKKREEIALLEKGQASEDDILAAKAKYHALSNEYVQFSKAMDLPQQRERISVDGLKGVDSSVGNSLANSEKHSIMGLGSDDVIEYRTLGKLNIQHLSEEFGKLQTDEVIVTNERIEHIKEHHPQDFDLFEQFGRETIINPDEIIKDLKHIGTVFMIKHLPETNLNVVVRLALETEKEGLKNSVMTFYRIRNRNLKKLIEKNKLLYNSV